MTDDALAAAVEATTLFARVSPAHKQRIIEALQAWGHTVGFMGDGINDAPALPAADVGVSVDSAVDIAKAAAAHSQRFFQTGWFVESLLTQTLIVHIIRTRKVPFVQRRASGAVLATSAAIVAVGVALPFTPLGGYLGFTAPPPMYWPYLAATLAGYVALTQAVKTWLMRRGWI